MSIVDALLAQGTLDGTQTVMRLNQIGDPPTIYALLPDWPPNPVTTYPDVSAPDAYEFVDYMCPPTIRIIPGQATAKYQDVTAPRENQPPQNLYVPLPILLTPDTLYQQ